MAGRDWRAWLLHLDQLRYDQPRPALAKLRAARRDVPKRFQPLYLGVVGSTYRNLAGQSSRLHHRLLQAEEHINLGRWLAENNEAAVDVGNLDLRLSYVFADRGDYTKALSLAEHANAIFERALNITGRGKALSCQGQYLYYLNCLNQAIAANRAALKLLPASEGRGRFAAYQVSGLCYLALGQHDTALNYAKLAEPLVPSPWFEAKLRWLEAKIHKETKAFEAAEEQLARVVEIMSQLHYGEAALATVELVEVQLQQGHLDQARETVGTLRGLIIPLNSFRVVSSALIELLRDGQHKLTLARVSHIKERIEGAREHQVWRSLAVCS